MTFTQLEYVVALNIYRQFSLAAEKCFVTQPTLSMQIQKLEEELSLRIFDRTKHPITPTRAGKEIVAYAKKILHERDALLEKTSGLSGFLKGELHLGIIPTLAPYLLPLFIPTFTEKYKDVKLVVNELNTQELVRRLKEGIIDAGILVTPLYESSLVEEKLFNEEMMVYTSRLNPLYSKEFVLQEDIDPDKLWLLEEGHCFRAQVSNLCKLKKNSTFGNRFEYEAGSLETLIRLVDATDGVTLLPELTTYGLTAAQLKQLRKFGSSKPTREVSIVTNKDFLKKQLINHLQKEILASLPSKIRENDSKNIISFL